MVYKNFEELNARYGHERSMMSAEEERLYVQDCFDTYEAIGFCKTFDSPYDDQAKYNGQEFSVEGRLSVENGEVDPECLPMWHIRFGNGAIIDAYPEEICLAEKQ